MPARPLSSDGWGREQGMVTAEVAVAMPAVVLVLLLVLSAVAAGLTQMRVADGARGAARQAAIGSDDVVAAAQRVVEGASVSVEEGPGASGDGEGAGGVSLTCVTVSRPVPGPLGGLGVTAASRACAYTEPSSP